MRNVTDISSMTTCMEWLDEAELAVAAGDQFTAGRLVERARLYANRYMGDGSEREAVMERLEGWVKL